MRKFAIIASLAIVGAAPQAAQADVYAACYYQNGNNAGEGSSPTGGL